MFTPQENDDVIGILREYNARAIVENSALIEETWVNSDVEIPDQDEYDAAKGRLAEKRVAQAALNSQIQSGFDTGLGFRLGLSKEAQAWITQTKVSLDALGFTNDQPVEIPDANNVKKVISFGQFKAFLPPYIMACFAIQKANWK